MNEITAIQSVSDLETVALKWEDKFFDPGLGYPPIWYRGQPQDLPPQPGVLRPIFLSCRDNDEIKMEPTGQRLWNREHTLNRQFRRMSSSLVANGLNLVGLYFLAQHHGLPTRLMDWTINPLAAVYFAASGSLDEDGVVFVLNSHELGNSVEMRDPKVEAVVSSLFDDGNVPFGATILPVLPDRVAGRMLQQSSCFTLHTPPKELNNGNHETIIPMDVSGVTKYMVPKAAKAKLRLTLRRLGVTDATLFPDLDHVASEIKNAWRLQPGSTS